MEVRNVESCQALLNSKTIVSIHVAGQEARCKVHENEEELGWYMVKGGGANGEKNGIISGGICVRIY